MAPKAFFTGLRCKRKAGVSLRTRALARYERERQHPCHTKDFSERKDNKAGALALAASERSERLNERSECKNTLTSDAVVVSPANEDKEPTQSNKREAIGAKEEASRAFQGRNLGRRRQNNWIAFEQMRLNEPCE